MNREKTAKKLLDQALAFLQFGYNQGALKCCAELKLRHPNLYPKCRLIEWIAYAYQTNQKIPLKRLSRMLKTLKQLPANEGLSELGVHFLRHHDEEKLYCLLIMRSR